MISVLLLQLRQWRASSVDMRLQCDDKDLFAEVLEGIPGTWHYKKPLHAYKAIRAEQGNEVVTNTIKFIQKNILNRINNKQCIVKIMIEGFDSLSKERQAKLQQAFGSYIY